MCHVDRIWHILFCFIGSITKLNSLVTCSDCIDLFFAHLSFQRFVYTKSGAVADNEIDAISGATITTNAVTNGVNAGLYYFQTELKGGSENE